MKGRKRPNRAVNEKIKDMISEGYRSDVAAAAAHSMARRGELGQRGAYQRKTNRPKGPRGKQRRGA